MRYTGDNWSTEQHGDIQEIIFQLIQEIIGQLIQHGDIQEIIGQLK